MLSHLKKLGDPINNTIISFYLKHTIFLNEIIYVFSTNRRKRCERATWTLVHQVE